MCMCLPNYLPNFALFSNLVRLKAELAFRGILHRHNQTTMQALMPNGTKFITILRHPISRFESAFLFEDFPAFLGISGSLNPLKNLMEDIDKFNPEISTMYTMRNSMSFDLGLGPEDFENADAVSNLIHSVKKNFDLELLVEYFDESLMLRKQQICWSLCKT